MSHRHPPIRPQLPELASTYGYPYQVAVLEPKRWPRQRVPGVVHGALPRQRVSCPPGHPYDDPIRQAWVHPPISRYTLIRAALPFAGAPGGPQVLPCFAKISWTPCGLPYAGRTIRCTLPSLPGCYQSSPISAGLDSFIVPDNQISRGELSTRQSSLHVTAWCLASLLV